MFNKQLEKDELLKPVGASLIESAGRLAGAATQVPALSIFEPVSKTLGIVSKCLSLGVPTVEENLKLLGELVEDSLLKLEERIIVVREEAHAELERFRATIKSEAFTDYLAIAVLHTQRTKQKSRLERMARILANGVAANDVEPENLDDMMRAAAELKDADVQLLGRICDSQRSLLKQRGLNPTNWFGQVQSYWNDFVNSGALDASKHLVYRSSFSRLESHGLIQKFREISTASVGFEHYALLEEGLRFYERLQEIGSPK